MADSETTTYTVSFTINDGTDPVQGATVTIGSTDKTTGSAGGCTFDNMEEGTVSVEVSKDGFTTKTEEISIDSTHLSFTISLEATTQETGGTGETQETGGNEQTGGETGGNEQTTEETTEEKFPSFRKAYKYRGGFDKWVYDQLKNTNESTENSGEE